MKDRREHVELFHSISKTEFPPKGTVTEPGSFLNGDEQTAKIE